MIAPRSQIQVLVLTGGGRPQAAALNGLPMGFRVRPMATLDAVAASGADPQRTVLVLDAAPGMDASRLERLVAAARERMPHLPIVVLEAQRGNVELPVEDRLESAAATSAVLERSILLALERRRTRISDSDQALCHLLLENVPGMVYAAEVQPSTPTRYASGQASRLLGFPVSDWLQEANLWSVQLHPQDRTRVQAELEKSQRTGRPFRCEYRMLTREGQVRRLIDHAVFVHEGTRALQVGVRLDVTDHGRSG